MSHYKFIGMSSATKEQPIRAVTRMLLSQENAEAFADHLDVIDSSVQNRNCPKPAVLVVAKPGLVFRGRVVAGFEVDEEWGNRELSAKVREAKDV